MKPRAQLPQSAERLLAELAESAKEPRSTTGVRQADVTSLMAADLVTRLPDGALGITPAGLAHVARARAARANAPVDPFRAQHLDLAQRALAEGTVTVNEAESPLVWLARRKGRDGQSLIAPVQLQAGERLRLDFTRARLMPRVTSNWSAPIAQDRRDAGQSHFTDAVIAARQRVRQALDAAGPEFAGLLLDVCCFLKGLAEVERERGWPPRSAKVVLQLGLDRLARHYGLAATARGRAGAPLRLWLAPEVAESETRK